MKTIMIVDDETDPRDESIKEISVIFLAAKPFSTNDIQRGIKFSDLEYLTKPFIQNQLLHMIETSLK